MTLARVAILTMLTFKHFNKTQELLLIHHRGARMLGPKYQLADVTVRCITGHLQVTVASSDKHLFLSQFAGDYYSNWAAPVYMSVCHPCP